MLLRQCLRRALDREVLRMPRKTCAHLAQIIECPAAGVVGGDHEPVPVRLDRTHSVLGDQPVHERRHDLVDRLPQICDLWPQLTHARLRLDEHEAAVAQCDADIVQR
ncbi:hypothetical protein ACFQHO_14880 [Actinomadura yumaensis]|uniref:hypothetical protein n=1 Tax=Actinomadura yumaensis TaxID=111807 RepID=UPI00361893FA